MAKVLPASIFTSDNRPAPWADAEQFWSNNFDFIRLALASLVIFSHSYLIFDGTGVDPLQRRFGGHYNVGGLSVNLFFIISGFLISHSLLRSNDVKTYLRKRILRIYPGFAVNLALMLLVFAPLVAPAGVAVFTLDNLFNVLARIPLLRQFSPTGVVGENPYPASLNGALWTISYEFGCYLILLAALWPRRWLSSALFCGAIVVLIAAPSIFSGDNGLLARAFDRLRTLTGDPVAWLRFASFFLSGALFHHFRHRIPFSNLIAAISFLLFLSAIPFPAAHWVAFPPSLTYLVFWLAYHPLIKLRHFGKWGDFSYGTYLYGFPVQQVIIGRIEGVPGPTSLTLIALPLTLCFAAFSWYAVERPALALKKRGRRLVVQSPVSSARLPDERVATSVEDVAAQQVSAKD